MSQPEKVSVVHCRLPSIPSALEFRRMAYGWTQTRMALALGISKGRYSEVIHHRRNLSRKAMCKAFELGVPYEVLLQTPVTKRAYEKRINAIGRL